MSNSASNNDSDTNKLPPIVCWSCNYSNDGGETVCAKCGNRLIFPTIEIKDVSEYDIDASYGTKTLTNKLILHVRDAEKPLVIELDKDVVFVLGRMDSSIDGSQAINLSPFGAADKGVSRRHATLSYGNGLLRITDLNSTNHTYLNGQKLPADYPRVIRNGDEVRLGQFVIKAVFQEQEE